MVITRFAPSPTGALHAGTVRTALFAWLAARHGKGRFILRVEDTDRNREVKGAVQNIIDSLKYLGLDWDEGPDKGGPGAPYFQSQRLDLYKQWGEALVSRGRAYADPYTPEEVQSFRDQAQKAKKAFLFREHRPENPPKWDGSQPLRFKSDPKAYDWRDLVMGDLSTGPKVVDDFILIKSDGFPTYNFAHIIDDHLMDVNLVARSQEFISSMPNFLNLYQALEIAPPDFATVPMVLDEAGNKKLSKRAGAKQLLDYQRMGVLPDALMNTLATTGWNDGTEQEIFSVDELIAKFSLDRVQKSGAHFDERRLLWINGHYIRNMGLEDLAGRAEEYWPAAAAAVTPQYKLKVLELLQERLKYLAELPELSVFFFEKPDDSAVKELYTNPPDKMLATFNQNRYGDTLKSVLASLQASDFSLADISARLNALLESLNSQPGILFPIIRIALCGQSSSPELAGTMEVLGREAVIARLSRALELVQNFHD